MKHGFWSMTVVCTSQMSLAWYLKYDLSVCLSHAISNQDLEDRGSTGVTCWWKINRTWRWHGLTLEKSLMTDHCGEAMSPSVEGLRSCSHYTLICTDMRVSAHLSKTLTTFTLCACLRRSALHWVWRVLKVWGNRVGTLDLCALMTWVAALHCNN